MKKFLIQIEDNAETGWIVNDALLRGCLQNAVRDTVSHFAPNMPVVTVIQEETSFFVPDGGKSELTGPEMHFRACDCGAWSLCKKCHGLGVIKFSPRQ